MEEFGWPPGIFKELDEYNNVISRTDIWFTRYGCGAQLQCIAAVDMVIADADIPEPGALAMLALGLAGLGLSRRKQ